MLTPIRSDVSRSQPYGPERDACAIYLSVRKRGLSTHDTLNRALTAVRKMAHRTGYVNGEGDGAGIQTDIPRELWAINLSQAGRRPSTAAGQEFWVGHLLVPNGVDYGELQAAIEAQFVHSGLEVIFQQPGKVNLHALGRQARLAPPAFWQLAGYSEYDDLEKRLFAVQTQLEASLPIHFASLSSHVVVYKVRGSVQALADYYPELSDRSFATSMTLCHARYSTNTVSAFERAQPFSLLGHNGEINTINRLRQEAAQIGVRLPRGGSDSQDLDRTLQTLCVDYGLDLIEAMEMIFPPIPHELASLPPALQAVYTRMRHAFGPYAQGPAAIVARYGDTAVASVDALGLRPLWFVETEKEHCFSSERGVIPLRQIIADPRPLAPGEKVAIRTGQAGGVEVMTHGDIRRHVAGRAGVQASSHQSGRFWIAVNQPARPDPLPAPPPSDMSTPQTLPVLSVVATEAPPEPQPLSMPIASAATLPWHELQRARRLDTPVLAALGWQREHVQEIDLVVSSGKDPVGSLGHDGPLAALSQSRVNLADFFKETVAVVTNPSIDRGREGEAFSTGTLVGSRPSIGRAADPLYALPVRLEVPLLPGGEPGQANPEVAEAVAGRLGTLTLEQLLAAHEGRTAWLAAGTLEGETVRAALDRLADEAVEAVRAGAQCLVIDDTPVVSMGLGWVDPLLVTGHIDECLRQTGNPDNLRRRTGIVVRSASVRTLHDIALLIGFGADAINPYAMLGVATNSHTASPLEDEQAQVQAQYELLNILIIGLEKVTSTMGCHELRGYGRVFSAIGLAPSLAALLRTPNYFGSEAVGLTWKRLDEEARVRAEELRGIGAQARLPKIDRFYPKFWKKIISFVRDEIAYDEVSASFQTLSETIPVALRHIVEVKTSADQVDPDEVDLSIGDYSLPFVIGAMSFGSQGELSYRSYAQAAAALNIICINGEGGELPELMGIYKHNRGQQVASARFGVNAEFLNSAAVLEIKIGQGAKPGEGGMLPAHKVTPRVATARRTNPFIPLLSPSNNHDLYSIEDLAQLIEELKTVNPQARVSVKCPVVPGIGMIAVGVAKAGADIINLTGYDGATGAARRHALQYVGLPAEIGLVQVHRALIEAGLRDKVELWCDGGMKTGADAMKMILLGANRVGFATIAMVSIGCTICRKCHEGTCHVGITTHIKTIEEAQEKGLSSFVPREYDHSVEGVRRVFEGIGGELRQLAAQLGATRLQDLVGRADLLEQARLEDKIDLSAMFERVPVPPVFQPTTTGANGHGGANNHLTHFVSEIALASLAQERDSLGYHTQAGASDRALGAHLVGELVRRAHNGSNGVEKLPLRFGPSSVVGNGAAAWITDGVDVLIEGGAQDGVAKSASGGYVAVMQGLNASGRRVDGSVGKSFAYGAQRGILLVQGNADSRACIRLSGADVVFGGMITRPIDDSAGNIGMNANLKGFACEYMTSGRVVILGDPGPYAFAGMTGGVVYQMLSPEMGFDAEALVRRLARGAEVVIKPIEPADIPAVQELLGHYAGALQRTHQDETAAHIDALAEAERIAERFVKVVPVGAEDGLPMHQ